MFDVVKSNLFEVLHTAPLSTRLNAMRWLIATPDTFGNSHVLNQLIMSMDADGWFDDVPEDLVVEFVTLFSDELRSYANTGSPFVLSPSLLENVAHKLLTSPDVLRDFLVCCGTDGATFAVSLLEKDLIDMRFFQPVSYVPQLFANAWFTYLVKSNRWSLFEIPATWNLTHDVLVELLSYELTVRGLGGYLDKVVVLLQELTVMSPMTPLVDLLVLTADLARVKQVVLPCRFVDVVKEVLTFGDVTTPQVAVLLGLVADETLISSSTGISHGVFDTCVALRANCADDPAKYYALVTEFLLADDSLAFAALFSVIPAFFVSRVLEHVYTESQVKRVKSQLGWVYGKLDAGVVAGVISRLNVVERSSVIVKFNDWMVNDFIHILPEIAYFVDDDTFTMLAEVQWSTCVEFWKYFPARLLRKDDGRGVFLSEDHQPIWESIAQATSESVDLLTSDAQRVLFYQLLPSFEGSLCQLVDIVREASK